MADASVEDIGRKTSFGSIASPGTALRRRRVTNDPAVTTSTHKAAKANAIGAHERLEITTATRGTGVGSTCHDATTGGSGRALRLTSTSTR